MASKIGLVGGIGWPGTVAYYNALCRAARSGGGPGSPEMTIESLDMERTLAARGRPGNAESWRAFDLIFTEALGRLARAGCDLAAIASVTPHARLEAISQSAPLPIVSLIDAVAQDLPQDDGAETLVLGTSVTMAGALFDGALARHGYARREAAQGDIAAFVSLLDAYFYAGREKAGRAALMDYLGARVDAPDRTLVLLGCTDLAPAFPEAEGKILFDAIGFRFLDTTQSHVAAILRAAGVVEG